MDFTWLSNDKPVLPSTEGFENSAVYITFDLTNYTDITYAFVTLRETNEKQIYYYASRTDIEGITTVKRGTAIYRNLANDNLLSKRL